MSRQVTLMDDLDGSSGAEERRFGIGTTQYAIDLTEDNWAAFLRDIEKYRTHARVTTDRREVVVPVRSAEDRARIRAWAVANNRYIPTRGRFPNDVVRDYYATMAREPAEFIRA